MGYQVETVCYVERKQAENAYFSGVKPVITADGKLIQMQYTPAGWILNGQVIQVALPECDPVESFRDGQYIGWAVFAIMAVVWGVRVLHERLRL